MTRLWLAAAALGGFLSVVPGAFDAHLAAGDARAAELLRTGALYGMVHAVALTAVAAMAEPRGRPGLLLAIAGWGFAADLQLFNLSLFGADRGRVVRLGYALRRGGLLIGWAALGLQASQRR